jgi:hypothetical protein
MANCDGGVGMACPRCNHENVEAQRLFCENCGAVVDRSNLRAVRLLGPVGVQHSNSPKIEQFWETGDPSVFASPGAKDYVG